MVKANLNKQLVVGVLLGCAAVVGLGVQSVRSSDTQNMARAERLDAVEVRLHGSEGARFGIIADIDGIQDLIAQGLFGIDSHKTASQTIFLYLYCTQIMEKGKSAKFIKSSGGRRHPRPGHEVHHRCSL